MGHGEGRGAQWDTVRGWGKGEGIWDTVRGQGKGEGHNEGMGHGVGEG